MSKAKRNILKYKSFVEHNEVTKHVLFTLLLKCKKKISLKKCEIDIMSLRKQHSSCCQILNKYS